MDTQTVTLVSVVAVVVVVLLVILRFRRRVRARIKAPGIDMAVDGSNDPAPGVVAENITSRAGGVKARDETGRGVHARGIDAHKDVEIFAASGAVSKDPKA
jgi:membrane protein implicated in regulation of membrane protease activity